MNPEGLDNRERVTDFEIQRLLEELSEYNYLYELHEEEWWGIENEANCGKDRDQAKKRLEEFLAFIKQEARRVQ